MKLLNKSTLYYSAWLLPVIIASGFFAYEIISWQIKDSTDESLLKEKSLVIKSFSEKNKPENFSYHYGDGDVWIKETTAGTGADFFTDIELFDSLDKEMIPFRKLSSSFEKGGRHFQMVITRSVIESDELAGGIAQSLALLFGLMLLGFLSVNRILSRRLWRPFNQSLSTLNSLSFAGMKPNPFGKESIQEFSELNAALNRMTAKMLSDFNSQKQFTENASHEMQTPLAVIKVKLDTLIQSPRIAQGDLQLVESIEASVNKLSQLNKSLLLLSKIENRQFDDSREINLSALFGKIMLNFADHIQAKNISIQKDYADVSVKKINPFLAEILFSNLIQNALRYNVDGGTVKIKLNENDFSICNSGAPLQGNGSGIFNRFTKFNSSLESLGLGLSIAKQICSYYNWTIDYKYDEEMHCFQIIFLQS